MIWHVLVAVLIEFLGLHLLARGRDVLATARGFHSRAVPGQGEVIRLRTSREGVPQHPRYSHVYHPVLRFTTADGVRVEAESPVGANPAPAQPGDTVSILYDPANPHHVRINDLKGRGTLVGGILIALGTAFLVAALALILLS
ncbi:hypothetical protein Aph01nite_21980 [Acrocarpospora phusangensis]|uniref:DUF3592 domain-containing protein n=1 Tax=Acrocarpospora phusangensis TaxID=1070424 RepID=A0A919Q8D6_9ACTN|nr:DUF3592 domain-containing protein [Acrocarpospora phusangensis]GIH23888.1 hypothetical protein Aph01nite_21980 [Acrocarpospora phusangensis]